MLHYVNPNTDNNDWQVNTLDKKEHFFIDNGLNFDEVMKLFEVTIPYIGNVKFETLDQILKDETDLLTGFRNNLKKVIKESQVNFKSKNEIQQDSLNPEIEKLSRKFNRIKNSHRLQVGASVGTFTLTLLFGLYQDVEIIKLVAPAITGLIGGNAVIASENKYQDSLDTLRDNNYYLLWRIKKND